MAKLIDFLPTLPVGIQLRRTSETDGGAVCFETDKDDPKDKILTIKPEHFLLTQEDFQASDWQMVIPPEVWKTVTRVQARNALAKGKVVRRKCWTDPGQNLAGIVQLGDSVVYRKSGLWCNCLHRLFDKTANDWEVLV